VAKPDILNRIARCERALADSETFAESVLKHDPGTKNATKLFIRMNQELLSIMKDIADGMPES